MREGTICVIGAGKAGLRRSGALSTEKILKPPYIG